MSGFNCLSSFAIKQALANTSVPVFGYYPAPPGKRSMNTATCCPAVLYIYICFDIYTSYIYIIHIWNVDDVVISGLGTSPPAIK